LFYYGGLGAMTALELIDWPVTLAVAAGYALATRDRHEENGQQGVVGILIAKPAGTMGA
jgi:hypothetical protein